MTKEEILEMKAGRELNIRVAEDEPEVICKASLLAILGKGG